MNQPKTHCTSFSSFFSFFLRFYLLIFRERGREGARGGDIIDWLSLAHPQPRDLACNPGMCSDWESNQRLFDLQDDVQPTEPYQSGLHALCIYYFLFLFYTEHHDCYIHIAFPRETSPPKASVEAEA